MRRKVVETFSRREFLRIGSAGLAGAVMLGTAGCGEEQGGSGTGEVVFSMTQDPTGVTQKLVDRFNRQNKIDYTIRYRQMPPDTGQYFDQLRTELQAGASEIDVIGGDVIWPAQLAANGWIADLSDRFPEEERQKFLNGPIQSNVYEGSIYGVPWYTDAGMLFYRRDLLADAGSQHPPRTWQSLKEQARVTQQRTGTKFGFVFQGAQYEGGVVDALEYIYSHGGRVLEEGSAERVVIDSPESTAGLATQRSMIEDGIAPQAVTTYKEDESTAAFLNGDAVFLRNWPYVYAQAADPDASRVRPEQIGIAALPASEAGRSVSGLGGWNFYISAGSDPEVQDAAWEFVRWMTAKEQQRFRALNGSFLPTLEELYEDRELRNEVPIIALGEEAIQNTRPRPVSPYYSDMSLEMAEQFNASLNGDILPEKAAATLQEELSSIIEQAG